MEFIIFQLENSSLFLCEYERVDTKYNYLKKVNFVSKKYTFTAFNQVEVLPMIKVKKVLMVAYSIYKYDFKKDVNTSKSVLINVFKKSLRENKSDEYYIAKYLMSKYFATMLNKEIFKDKIFESDSYEDAIRRFKNVYKSVLNYKMNVYSYAKRARGFKRGNMFLTYDSNRSEKTIPYQDKINIVEEKKMKYKYRAMVTSELRLSKLRIALSFMPFKLRTIEIFEEIFDSINEQLSESEKFDSIFISKYSNVDYIESLSNEAPVPIATDIFNSYTSGIFSDYLGVAFEAVNNSNTIEKSFDILYRNKNYIKFINNVELSVVNSGDYDTFKTIPEVIKNKNLIIDDIVNIKNFEKVGIFDGK